MQVLIVSQVTPVRHTLRVLLERKGHKVSVADNVENAIEAISKQARLDIVVTEWKLDDGTAVTLHRRSQEIDRVADHGAETNAPHFIVLATPQASSRMNDGHSVRDEIQSFGFHDVFEKPVNRQALINRIRVIAVQRAMRPSNVGPMPRAEPPVHCPAPPLDGVVAAESASRLEDAVGEIRCRLDSHCQRLFAIAQMLRELADDIASVAAETSPAAAPERCHADVAGAIVD